MFIHFVTFEQNVPKGCTVGEKKKNVPINTNTNYRREMKLVPINMHYCLLQFDALKLF